MASQHWFALQLITALVAGLYAVAAAVLLFYEAIADQELTDKTRNRLASARARIQNSPISHLPEQLLGIGASLTAQSRALTGWLVTNKIGMWITAIAAYAVSVLSLAIAFGFLETAALHVPTLIGALLGFRFWPS